MQQPNLHSMYFPGFPPPPPPRPNLTHKNVLLAVVVGLIVLGSLVVLVGGALLYLNWTTIGEQFGPSCTLGMSGTAETMTAQGWSANAACDDVLNSAQNHSSGTFYRFQGAPQGNILCQFTYQGDRYTVRDSGLLDLVGNQVCTNLKPYISSGN